MNQLRCHTIAYFCAITRKHLQLLRRQCGRFALCSCTKPTNKESSTHALPTNHRGSIPALQQHLHKRPVPTHS